MSDTIEPRLGTTGNAIQLSPGSRATSEDLHAVQYREDLMRTELRRLREAAAAWRNGLGALLAALVGFGLIKGRSDVGQLAPECARIVGVVLLVSLATGTVGALTLLRAAHGSPALVKTQSLRSRRVAEHLETEASARALRRGIGATLGCVFLLTTAVGVTWYGPEKSASALRITTPSGTLCGRVARLDRGSVTLRTKNGDVTSDLATAISIQPVDACP